MRRYAMEPEENPDGYGVLDGHECPCCRKGFFRKDTIIYAEQEDADISYYFHKECLPDDKQEFLEDLGFDLEERDGASFDL